MSNINNCSIIPFDHIYKEYHRITSRTRKERGHDEQKRDYEADEQRKTKAACQKGREEVLLMPAPAMEMIVQPDIITAAIKLLAGAVITLGGMLVAGGRWVAMYLAKQMNQRMDGMEGKLGRLADGMESLALTTSNQITKIETRCDERHANHRRNDDDRGQHV